MGFFLGTQEGARDSRGKRAIGVLATEVLLYIAYHVFVDTHTERNN